VAGKKKPADTSKFTENARAGREIAKQVIKIEKKVEKKQQDKK
jgi:hypothetical protein